MLSTGTPLDWALVDVAVPRPSDRLPGISMAGFRQRAPGHVDIAMIAHPSVTLLVDLSEEGTKIASCAAKTTVTVAAAAQLTIMIRFTAGTPSKGATPCDLGR